MANSLHFLKKTLNLTAIIAPIILASYIGINELRNNQKDSNKNNELPLISNQQPFRKFKLKNKVKKCHGNLSSKNIENFYHAVGGMEPLEIIYSTTNRPRPSIDCLGMGADKQSCIYWRINDTFRKYVISGEGKLEFITCKEVKKECPIECRRNTYDLKE